MADVFVSYARLDKARVAPLVGAIEAQGWSVWWDPEITPGQEFDSQIDAELQKATVVVVVWTPASVGSRWVRGEAREAADRGDAGPGALRGRPAADRRARDPHDRPRWLERRHPRASRSRICCERSSAMIALQRASLPAAQAVPARPGCTRRDRCRLAAAARSARVTICVLPFANMSGDPEQEYFSDGISEDIITDLSKVSALAVVSRNTAFTFKGKNVDVPQVARQLKVGYVLEGSVRKAGGRVRISAQLIDGANDSHVWAERYDRDSTTSSRCRTRSPQAIVKALKLKLLPEEKKAIEQRGTTNAEAYNFYLMARQHYATGIMSDVRRSDTVIRLCRARHRARPELRARLGADGRRRNASARIRAATGTTGWPAANGRSSSMRTSPRRMRRGAAFCC